MLQPTSLDSGVAFSAVEAYLNSSITAHSGGWWQSVTSICVGLYTARPVGLVLLARALGKHRLTSAPGQRCASSVSPPRCRRRRRSDSGIFGKIREADTTQAGRLQAGHTERRRHDGSCTHCVECLLCNATASWYVAQ